MSQNFKNPFINCPAELSAERKLLHGDKTVRVNKSKFLFPLFQLSAKPETLSRRRDVNRSRVNRQNYPRSRIFIIIDFTVRVTRLSALAITFVFMQLREFEKPNCPT